MTKDPKPYPDAEFLFQLIIDVSPYMREVYDSDDPAKLEDACRYAISAVEEKINLKYPFPKLEFLYKGKKLESIHHMRYAIMFQPWPLCISVLEYRTFPVPIEAVVYDYSNNFIVRATRGGGALFNGQKTHVSTKSTLNQSVVSFIKSGDFDFNSEKFVHELDLHQALCFDEIGFRYSASMLSLGDKGEAVVFAGNEGYEVSALQLIVEESGGRVTDLRGLPLDYDHAGRISGAILSNGVIHDEIVNLVNKVNSK